ncbi:four-carbon acid sugar kinase family protein [Mahella australiensis]|uniref:Type III effector Hrp-dependent outer protein n=1 Tax=Mahella australiensis (strain DSM 15567 / CIP 107919 / 50-1 BON) TaxID=697281 RepID=F4A270_MAHA5|nr:four-carbon acid sugar kinase family protein [Mahella australiensis]AEE97209.1 type III effector Hrp-dependent outer protein [Mahella australiensis 50-1 BON]
MIGVVADDITGANDIGIMFAKSDYLVYVYRYDAFRISDIKRFPDVIILNTDSRLDDADVAYQKVFYATEMLRSINCVHFFKKTCSVFRGNVGAEFDAMLDALSMDFGIIVLGFPKNGRITKDGIHYVHGKRLEESEFRNDPVHPMLKSNIIDILQEQTRRNVGLINYRQIAEGSEKLKKVIDDMRSRYNYLIFDVLSQRDLRVIAEATSDEVMFGGSSALAEELPAFWGPGCADIALPEVQRKEGLGILCVAGSLMPQTARQVRYFCNEGAVCFELNTLRLFDDAERRDEVQRLTLAVSDRIISGRDAVIYSDNDENKVARTKAMGISKGLSSTEVSRLVSETIAEITSGVINRSGQNRILVAGGETSAAVCDKLGINGLIILDEIQPGLPSCMSISRQPMLLILKSGSFGSDDFFVNAVEYLKNR